MGGRCKTDSAFSQNINVLQERCNEISHKPLDQTVKWLQVHLVKMPKHKLQSSCTLASLGKVKHAFHHLAIAKLLYSTIIFMNTKNFDFSIRTLCMHTGMNILYAKGDKHQCEVLFPEHEMSPFLQLLHLTPQAVWKNQQKHDKSYQQHNSFPDPDFMQTIRANKG